MKCVYFIRRLFFLNLLSLLWWPYFCDIRQDATNPEGIQNLKDSSDTYRIENVPTQQKEIDQSNIGQEAAFKENIVQPSVGIVNNEMNVQNSKEGFIDNAVIPEGKESFQLDSSIHASSQFTVSNSDSSEHINVHDNRQKETLTRHLNEDESVQLNPSIQSNELDGEKSIKAEVSPSFQTKPISATKMEMPENTINSDPLKPKAASLDVSEQREIKSDPEVVVPFEAPVDVASFQGPIGNAHQHPSQYDGMPSFDEWKKMMLAEQEKGGQKVPSPTPPGKKISSQKRRRNYSSYECGAKIVASNSEAEGTNRILNELVDEYMLNPCKAKIWFVIELCETVQTSQIELANFELFSSCPKEFTVYSSDNFPTRDWVTLGTYTAAEQRVLQSFELKQEGFGKFIKIELSSYYGKEHYCPLSVVRIFGTSMVDEYEEMETLASQLHVPEDDLDRLDITIEDQGATNIFGSATDAVMNIVKKAAQVLGQHQPLEEKESNKTAEQLNSSETKLCKFMSSDNKCEDDNTSSTISKLINFTAPLGSAQRSLFRHLHRCDQCVPSRLGYYSSAQPQCRFFQAALGPVMFKALCDWFKEHSLVIPQETIQTQAHIINNVVSSGSTLVMTQTKSPPPQIIRIPMQDETSSYATMALSNVSEAVLSHSDTTVTVDITNISRFRLNKTLDSNRVKLQVSIEPTRTVKLSDVVGNNSSVASDIDKSSQILQSTEVPSPTSTKIVELGPENTQTITAEEAKLMNVTSSDQLMDDFKPKSTEEQFSEMLSDVTTITPEELATAEAMTNAEFQQSDTKQSDTVSIPGIISAGQKESVFMRMGNRIKSLELNMSLSSQYLQELSQRYRRQMEEMQRTFNRTIGTLNDTAKKAAEKDLKQQEVINGLQSQVENLTKTVELLMSGRSSVFRQMMETHVCLMVTEAIIMITIMSLCVRRISSAVKPVVVSGNPTPASPSRVVTKRRNSADSGSAPIARKVKKRSNSEEVLVAGENLLNTEPQPVLAPTQKMKKKNRKRHKALQHSSSQPAMPNQISDSTSSHSNPKERHCNHSPTTTESSSPSQPVHFHTQQPCENCNSGTLTTNCVVVKMGDKERRLHTGPLRNLTNGGTVANLRSVPLKKENSQKDKDSFSLRKFLKLQKRDSI